jgi:KaiC/GvpD/RAD55 family RecA-like ATPase
MLVYKEGFQAKGGKTTKALTKAIELILQNKKVVYVTNEMRASEIRDRLWDLDADADDNIEKYKRNFFYMMLDDLDDNFISMIKDDVSIISDVGKDTSNINCKQDLYVLYQVNACFYKK